MKSANNLLRRSVSAWLTVLILTIFGGATAFAQTTAFTYQGRFTDSTMPQPTNGAYSMTFRLFDVVSGGTQVPTTPTSVMASVVVINGIFTVPLDFGATAFNPGLTASPARYLEIQVGSAAPLSPRQEITPTPFASRAISANAADSLSTACVGCVTDAKVANGISYTKLMGAPTSLPPSGSAGGDLAGMFPNPSVAADAITSAKIANGTIVNADISGTAGIDGAKIVGNTITSLNAGNLASGVVPVGRLGTNSPSATTFLRGDNTWATPGSSGGVTLQVSATNTAAQSITGPTTVNLSFNNIITSPTAGTFNNTTFTATTAGLYLINVSVAGTGLAAALFPAIVVSGTPVAYSGGAGATSTLGTNLNRNQVSMTVALSVNDTVTISVTSTSTNSTSFTTDGTTRLAITKLN